MLVIDSQVSSPFSTLFVGLHKDVPLLNGARLITAAIWIIFNMDLHATEHTGSLRHNFKNKAHTVVPQVHSGRKYASSLEAQS